MENENDKRPIGQVSCGNCPLRIVVLHDQDMFGFSWDVGARPNDFYVSQPCLMGQFSLVKQGPYRSVNDGSGRDAVYFPNRYSLASC